MGLTLLTSAQAPDQRAEAERLANSGAHAAAVKQFQALAAANPDDIEARVWIAQLHALMGRPEHAADVPIVQFSRCSRSMLMRSSGWATRSFQWAG